MLNQSELVKCKMCFVHILAKTYAGVFLLMCIVLRAISGDQFGGGLCRRARRDPHCAAGALHLHCAVCSVQLVHGLVLIVQSVVREVYSFQCALCSVQA